MITTTDYMEPAERSRALVPGHYTVLVTERFGRSNSPGEPAGGSSRSMPTTIATTAMVDLFRDGAVDEATLKAALAKYDINSTKPNPGSSKQEEHIMPVEVNVPDIGDFEEYPGHHRSGEGGRHHRRRGPVDQA